MFTVTIVPVDLLKPHPKAREIPPLDDKIRREMAEDIRQNGIATPLILARDYTILAGHQRWEIAKELGMTHVPAIVRQDIGSDAPEAVALLVKDNLFRRQLNDVQVAKLIRMLKEEYGVKRGGYREPKLEGARESKDQNDPLISRMADGVGRGGYREPKLANIRESNGENCRLIAKIASGVGLSERTVRQLDKLNDLIPELQGLVSRKKLGSTAAYSLAFLLPEEQRDLLEALGESGVCGLSVQEAQELKRQLDAERARAGEVEGRVRELEKQLAAVKGKSGDADKLAAELARLRAENEELKARKPQVVEKVVEKVVPDPERKAREAEIKRLNKVVQELERRVEEAEAARREDSGTEELDRELAAKRAELERLQAERTVLEDWLKGGRSAKGLLTALHKLFLPLEKAREEMGQWMRSADIGPLHRLEIEEWISLLDWYQRRLRDLTRVQTVQGTQVIDITDYREARKDEC